MEIVLTWSSMSNCNDVLDHTHYLVHFISSLTPNCWVDLNEIKGEKLTISQGRFLLNPNFRLLQPVCDLKNTNLPHTHKKKKIKLNCSKQDNHQVNHLWNHCRERNPVDLISFNKINREKNVKQLKQPKEGQRK